MRFVEAFLAGSVLLACAAVAQQIPLVNWKNWPAAVFRTSASLSRAKGATFARCAVPSSTQHQSEGPLVAQDAWVRATPGADVAAAYLTIRNVSTSPVTVTGIESPVAGHAMIHETTTQGGQSRMRPHEQLVVAPGATVKLQPGGLHVMLHELKQPLTVGQSVPLVIKLAGGGTLQVTAAVRPLSAE